MDVEGLEVRITGRKNKAITYWKGEELVGRKCTVCEIDKKINEFSFKKTRNIYNSVCKECVKKKGEKWRGENPNYLKQWREENHEKKKEYDRQYRKENVDKEKERTRKYYENNIDKIREKNKNYYKNNSNKLKEAAKQYRENNPDKIRERNKKYRENNIDKIKEYKKQYFGNNKETISQKGKLYRTKNKEEKIQEITNLLERINPIFKQLKLSLYGYVYKFENVKSGRAYIGQTIRPLKERYRNSNIIQGWIKERLEYDSQKFKEELIEEDIVVTEILDVAFCQYHLDKLEAYYIDKYNSFLNGYNNREGNYITDDGIEEFMKILQRYNLEFVDGQIIKKVN